MKAVILAGGLGTRISEETSKQPKPMISVCKKPILFHIMEHLSNHGIEEFIICLGYMGYVIKEYFVNMNYHNSDIQIDLKTKKVELYKKKNLNWKINLIDTGEFTMTGGRLKRIKEYLDDDDFIFTYGDGLSNVNVSNLVKFHKSHKKLATVTAVKPLGRYGAIEIDNQSNVKKFSEKPKGDVGWINGGYFVLNPKCIDLIEEDATFWEREPLNNLVNENQLMAFKHEGFWHAVDTMRDKITLEDAFIKSGKYPWT